MIMRASISKDAISIIAETEAELIDIRRMSERTFKSSYVTPSSSRYVGGKGMIFLTPEESSIKVKLEEIRNKYLHEQELADAEMIEYIINTLFPSD